jgi:hypothetical protein
MDKSTRLACAVMLLSLNIAPVNAGTGDGAYSIVAPSSALLPKQDPRAAAQLNAVPIDPPLKYLPAQLDDTPVTTNAPATLHGSVEFEASYARVAGLLNDLESAALARDHKTQAVDQAVKHYQRPIQKVFKGSKDALNYMLCNRGFLPSTEVGKVLLGEDKSTKSRNLAELAKQKQLDDVNIKVVSGTMQMAMGLGMSDKARGTEIVGDALVSLNELVGPDATNKAFGQMKQWSKSLAVPESVYGQKSWDIKDGQKKVDDIVSLALAKDPIAAEVTKKIHKYSHHGKLSRASASVIETSLNAASLTPTLIGPAAQAALLTFFMSTGGTEEDKIIREVYLDKRLQSRADAIYRKANMATNAYQTALLTHNSTLLGMSESVVKNMAGTEAVKKVFGQSVFKQTDEPGQKSSAAEQQCGDSVRLAGAGD